nr:uncharacterized protein C12orf43-like [Leptinotarsa decemlineata]
MSCSSSDDENLELLKEAQDRQFLNDRLFTGSKEKLNSEITNKVSEPLRKSADDENYNFFKVTPEFRTHVAKHLSSLLDKHLKKNLEYTASDDITRKKRKKGGIKLLSDSEKYLKVESESLEVSPKPKKLIRTTKHQIQVDEESLQQLSVSGVDILKKKGIEHWSKRSKAQVFQYKKTCSGELMLVD